MVGLHEKSSKWICILGCLCHITNLVTEKATALLLITIYNILVCISYLKKK